MKQMRVALTGAVLLASVAWAAGPARAQPAEGDVPTISLAETDLGPGDRVVVSLAGWTSRHVTLSVCGNLAQRGATDCNMIASQSLKLVNTAEPTLTELVVAAPPGTCPCVIRGSSATQDEVALAPIELAGVPVGPVLGPAGGSLVAVSIGVRGAPRGLLGAVRSSLAGPASYVATITVRNLTAETLSTISLAGSAGRSRTDDAVSFEIPPPGLLTPGQTWEHEVRVTLPAPLVKRVEWRVIASGAGAPVTAQSSSRHTPLGLVVLLTVLVVDVVAMVCRTPARRRSRRRSRRLRAGTQPSARPTDHVLPVRGLPTPGRASAASALPRVRDVTDPCRHRRFVRRSSSLQGEATRGS